MTPAEVRQFVDAHRWFHTIDLGHGIVTPGAKTKTLLDAESAAIFRRLDLRDCTVMDVGAWNGYYTVETKRRGAAEILAIDSPTWLREDLRGKETFDFVMRCLNLSVQARVLDVQEIDEIQVGVWDVVLFLGVFYHLIDPIAAIMRLSRIAREALVIETCMDAQEYDRPVMVFYPGRELGNDPNCWWAPNRPALEALLRVAGFKHIEFTFNPAHKTRGIFHAFKTDTAYEKHAKSVKSS